jgi:uncharacterized membrane protein (DUF485 family)
MAHGPATEWKKEKSEDYKTRLGLIMFAIYVPIYLGFVFYCVFDPQGVGTGIWKLNVAIVYGFALIIIAIIQALVYNAICSRKEKSDHAPKQVQGGAK